ncbi:MAG TPA: choice-of-anchor D domain-containing protein [Silvibacterium sp.]|nr:choice-of-anchor D domain-containing protein [Silvibacterium sp.]
MKLHRLPLISAVSTLFQHPLALLGGLLLCVVPVAAPGQSVTFAGAESVLPTTGLDAATGVAVDSSGNVVISDFYNKRAVVLAKTPTGYAPQADLPTVGLSEAYGIAVDVAGDVFIPDCFNDRIVELPKTATGYGAQMTLPGPACVPGGQVALDRAGDVFLTAPYPVYNDIGELPWTGTGYGPLTVLTTIFSPSNIAADAAGDIFIVNNDSNVVELQKTPTGYGSPTPLPFSGLNFFEGGGVAVNSTGNEVIVADTDNDRILQEQMTATGWGSQTTLPTGPLNFPRGLFLDNAGDLFIADQNNDRVLELQTHAVNFEGVNVCAPGQRTPAPCSETLTLNFNVNAGVTLGTPKVLTGGAPNLDFTLASGSTCTGAFSAGATCTVNVTFASLATGTRNGSVEVTDGSGNVLTTTPISGYGAPIIMPQLSVNPLDFGTIPFGSTSTLPLTITNIGQASFTLAPSINGPSYTISGSTCEASLTAGNSCTMQVEFEPVRVGLHHDMLALVTNGSINPAVKLTGSASGVGLTMESPLNFGTIASGTTETLPLAIYNFGVPGSPTVSFVVSDPVYQVLPGSPCVTTGVAAGQSCTLQVEFAPTSTGLHNQTIVITSSSGTVSKVELEGIAE